MIPGRLPAHGTDARYQRGCRCGACRLAHLRVRHEHYAREGREHLPMPPERSAVLVERGRRLQAETAAVATRGYARWTADDLAVALDYRYSAAEAALLLGRTLSAVRHIRRKRGVRPDVLPHRPRDTP